MTDLDTPTARPEARLAATRQHPRQRPPAAGDVHGALALGYGALCRRGAQGLCGVRPYLYTGALVTGLTPDAHAGRYCYASVDEAVTALQDWDGEGDPPGRWLKFKSATAERDGPGLAAPSIGAVTGSHA